MDKADFVDRYMRNELHLILRRALPHQAKNNFLVYAQPPRSYGSEIVDRWLFTGDRKA